MLNNGKPGERTPVLGGTWGWASTPLVLVNSVVNVIPNERFICYARMDSFLSMNCQEVAKLMSRQPPVLMAMKSNGLNCLFKIEQPFSCHG